MPVSVRRHVLALVREKFSLTQAELGALVGRAGTTIRSIEVGKLVLSPKLATLISAFTGVDRNWLLANDLSVPMPPLERVSSTLDPKTLAYDVTCAALLDLFVRLVTVLRRMEQSQAKRGTVFMIKEALESALEYDPSAEPWVGTSPGTYEFFRAHPQLMDPDLRKLVNLDYLIKDSHRRDPYAPSPAAKRALEKLAKAKPRRRKERTQDR